jgi:adenosylhomocysteine nucleosidase
MPRVALLAPMPTELTPLRKKIPLEAAGDGVFHTGRIAGADVVASTTGIGTEKAAAATHRVLDCGDIDHLVVVGIAGGLPGGLRVGDVVVPEVVIDGDGPDEFTPAQLGTLRPAGRLRTSDDLAIDDAHLAELVTAGVTALDMETSAIARVCEERGVPWSVVRSISDIAGESPLDDEMLAMMGPDGAPKPGAAARYIARHPGRVPALAQLARGAMKATSAAATTAIAACARQWPA